MTPEERVERLVRCHHRGDEIHSEIRIGEYGPGHSRIVLFELHCSDRAALSKAVATRQFIAAAITAAEEAEREACAKVADERRAAEARAFGLSVTPELRADHEGKRETARDIAAKVRARGTA